MLNIKKIIINVFIVCATILSSIIGMVGCLAIMYYFFLLPAIAFIQIGIFGISLAEFISHYALPF